MYFTDRGFEELEERRGDETVTLRWLSDQMRDFADEHTELAEAVDRFASWLARRDDEDDGDDEDVPADLDAEDA